jgi:hypothetical protein
MSMNIFLVVVKTSDHGEAIFFLLLLSTNLRNHDLIWEFDIRLEHALLSKVNDNHGKSRIVVVAHDCKLFLILAPTGSCDKFF